MEKIITGIADTVGNLQAIIKDVVENRLLKQKQEIAQIAQEVQINKGQTDDIKRMVLPVTDQMNVLRKLIETRMENFDLKVQNYIQSTWAEKYGKMIREQSKPIVIEALNGDHSNRMKAEITTAVKSATNGLGGLISKSELKTERLINSQVDKVKQEVNRYANIFSSEEINRIVQENVKDLKIDQVNGLKEILMDMNTSSLEARQPNFLDIYNGTVLLKSGVTSISTTGATYSNGVVTLIGGGNAVNSVFGRIGNVVAVAGDYTASQVTNVPAGNIAAITVQAALNELDTEKATDSLVVHLAGAETITGAKTFTGVTVVPTPVGGTEAVTKNYVDALVVGLLDLRGNYDASVNTFPASGGSGTAGAILKGDFWYISVAGTLGGLAVEIGDSVYALVDTPGQTSANWAVLQTNLSYVPVGSVTTIGAVPNANGATITGSALNLEPANATFGGVVTTAAQTFAGVKTFQNSAVFGKGARRTVTTNATATGAVTVDWTVTTDYKLTLTGNTTLSFTAPTIAAGELVRLTLRLTQDATGSRLVTWPSILWTGGSAPTLTTTASKSDIITFDYDGTTGSYYAVSSLNF